MATHESNHLQFRGESLEECKEFIAAVNKHARAQGKLRDDQWVAEFVADCLEDDALMWWSALDNETQMSWQRLRSAMAFGFRPLFHGKTGTEAEAFVYEIRRRAVHDGKANDPYWTAEFASECFVGAALRWYTSLDPSVRGNWDSLQQAIFAKYSHEFNEDSTNANADVAGGGVLLTSGSETDDGGLVQSSARGGSGGTPFTDADFIVALQRTNITVTAVKIIYKGVVDCIQVCYSGRWAAAHGRYTGLQGHSEETFHLQPGEVIVQIEGRSGTRLDSLQFTTSTGRKSKVYGGRGGSSFTWSGRKLVYISGRSWDQVDSLQSYWTA